MMRVLFVEEFDPAGVCLGHRDVLRARGIDARVALERAYTRRQLDADWLAPTDLGLREFSAAADVIVWAPGIGHASVDGGPWACQAATCGLDVPGVLHPPVTSFGPVPFSPQARHVAFFHGSVNVWAHRGRWARHYRDRGWTLATSTIDYAVEIDAAYLPPVVTVPGFARLRRDDEPLVLVQTPSDPDNCHTPEMIRLARRLAIPMRVGTCLTHKSALWLKTQGNAGFDHMRGSFSVNHVENCACGLAATCGLNADYETRFKAERLASLADAGLFRTWADLADALATWRDNPNLHREAQRARVAWAQTHFNTKAIGDRLVHFFRSLT